MENFELTNGNEEKKNGGTRGRKPKTENPEYEKIIEEQKRTIETMQAQMVEMQKQFSSMLAIMNNGGNAQKEEKREKEYVRVGCRTFSGATLCTKDESIQYLFEAGDVKDILAEDMKLIFRDSGLRNNKALFEKGLFYFLDEEDYNTYGIRPRVDLSVENIKRIVTQHDVDKMIREVKEMTKDKADLSIVHSLKFTIAQMWIDKENQPLKNWSYENRVALENYFGNKFDDLIANIGLYNFVKANRAR